MLYWTIVAPCALLIATWALRTACSFCSVASPDFWQAAIIVIVTCVGNLIVRYVLKNSLDSFGLGWQLASPLVTTVLILSLSLSVHPATSLMIALVQVSICCASYMALNMLNDMMLASVMMLPMRALQKLNTGPTSAPQRLPE